MASSAQWQGAERTEPRLQAARHYNVVCGLRHRYRTSDCGPLPPTAAARVFGFHEPDRGRLPGPRPACRAGQPEYPQAERNRWLKRHPTVHLHFTPTYSSWLNQVECWFSILGQQALQGVSFTSPRQLREAIDKFVKVYNQKAPPFEWTKAVVHPTAPKPKYADLCN